MDLEKFFDDEAKNQDVSFEFNKYFRGILKRKWLILSICLLLILPWLYYIKIQPSEYEAFTYIRFQNTNQKDIDLLTESRITEIRSRTFAERVVAQLGLTLNLSINDENFTLGRNDIFHEFYTTTSPVSGQYSLKFSGDNYFLSQILDENLNSSVIARGNYYDTLINQNFSINGFTFRLKPSVKDSVSEFLFKVSSFKSTVESFRSKIHVSTNKIGTLMMIRMIDRDRIIVAQMVNKLANIFVNESLSFNRNRNKDYNEIITNKLKLAEQNLREDQEALRRFNENFNVSLDADSKRRIDEYSEAEARINELNRNAEILNDLLNRIETADQSATNDNSEVDYIYLELVGHPMFEKNPNIGIYSRRLNDMLQNRNHIVSQFSESHRDAIEANNEILKIETEILSFCKNILDDIYIEMNSLETDVRRLDLEIKKLPVENQRLANLNTQVEISQKIYSELSARKQEAEITSAVEVDDIDIMDPAIPPDYPMNRDKKKKAAFGGFFSLFFAISIALLLEYLDKTVKSPDDVKKYLKLNVIGTIPKIEFDEQYELKDADKLKQIDSQLVTYDYSPTPIGEAYRALRTKIVFSKQTGKIKTLVISSFAPSDGKSFTSSNLSITLAQHKTNTLLVDSDLRRGVLHNTFGIPKEPGFSNYLMGMTRLDAIIKETYIPNLSLVSCGSMMPNPSELLGSIQLKRFIEEAKRHFDIVIFDSPPLNAATDSVVLGTQSDGVILIVRADVTNRNIAKQKLDLFDNVPANVIGVILNGTDTELAHDGYSYYHY